MAVSAAVCEIFSIKEWCDLENRVRVVSYLTLNNTMTLKSGLEVTQCH